MIQPTQPFRVSTTGGILILLTAVVGTAAAFLFTRNKAPSPMVEKFVEKAVMRDGGETIRSREVYYEDDANATAVAVEYHFTFADNIVSPANDPDFILEGSCQEGNQMKFLLAEQVTILQAEQMFPTGSLLVYDGDTFNGDCILEDEDEGGGSQILDPETNAAFLTVKAVKVSGKEVIVSGEVASFHHMFAEAEYNFVPLDEDQRSLRVGKFDVSERWDKEFDFGQDLPLQVKGNISAGFEGKSRGLRVWIGVSPTRLNVVPVLVHRTNSPAIIQWHDWKLSADVSYKASFRADASIDAVLSGQGNTSLIEGAHKFPFFTVPIHTMSHKLPKLLAKNVKKRIPGFNRESFLKLVLDVPFNLDYKGGLKFDGEVKASASIDSGVQEFELKIKGPLRKLKTDFIYSNDGIGDFVGFKVDYNINPNIDLELCLDVSFGPTPELQLDLLGIATAGPGVDTRLTVDGCAGTEPMPPQQTKSSAIHEVNCGKHCYLVGIDVGAAVGNAYVRTSFFGKEDFTPIFESFSLEYLIAKMCLLELPERTCGLRCCSKVDECVFMDELSEAEAYCKSDDFTVSPSPTKSATDAPTASDKQPTIAPSPGPTSSPTPRPTLKPTKPPSPGRTPDPTMKPTSNPTKPPTKNPTPRPSTEPTPGPTAAPTPSPTRKPTPGPSPLQTPGPTTRGPTKRPTQQPSVAATISPTSTAVAAEFINQAVFLDLEPLQGTEEFDDEGFRYHVNYNISYHDNIVSLAAAAFLLESVSCANSTMALRFSESIPLEDAEQMFQVGALVILDQSTIPVECNLGETFESDPEINSSFLLVASVSVEGSVVTLMGQEANWHYQYESQDILYVPVNSTDFTHRDLGQTSIGKFDVDKTWSKDLTYGKDNPEDDDIFQFDAEGSLTFKGSSKGLYFRSRLRKKPWYNVSTCRNSNAFSLAKS